MDLGEYGWNKELAVQFEAHAERGWLPARVVKQARDLSTLVTPLGERPGEVPGKFRHLAKERSDFPVVGDWVAIEPAGDDLAIIQAILPRRSAFARKSAGEVLEAQFAAANIDRVFLVSGLDGDFNLRRIERYLTTAWASGAEPIIVLNKADLCSDLPSVIVEVERVAPGTPVVAVSALTKGGWKDLESFLTPGKTVALLGSSGVGKSTLINRLLGEERLPTAPVSDADKGRGRHTTTARELVRLPGGALLIDTPGMRELQLWAEEDDLDKAFEEIDRLATRCRFPDCRHEQEPGCAVRTAVAAGTLDRRRLESYLKLRREMQFTELKKDVKKRRQREKAAGRRFARMVKEIKKHKPRYQ
jgi:ribosome biogenesis GTPase